MPNISENAFAVCPIPMLVVARPASPLAILDCNRAFAALVGESGSTPSDPPFSGLSAQDARRWRAAFERDSLNETVVVSLQQRSWRLRAASLTDEAALVALEPTLVDVTPLGHFAGGVAHQLSNQLTVLMNCEYTLGRDSPIARESRQETLASARAAIEHASQLIVGFSNYSRIGTTGRRATIDLSSCIEELVRIAECNFTRAGLRIVHVKPSGRVEVETDIGELRMALLQMVSAFLDLPHQSVLTVSIDRGSPPVVCFLATVPLPDDAPDLEQFTSRFAPNSSLMAEVTRLLTVSDADAIGERSRGVVDEAPASLAISIRIASATGVA